MSRQVLQSLMRYIGVQENGCIAGQLSAVRIKGRRHDRIRKDMRWLITSAREQAQHNMCRIQSWHQKNTLQIRGKGRCQET